jgi:hypothetical protein
LNVCATGVSEVAVATMVPLFFKMLASEPVMVHTPFVADRYR